MVFETVITYADLEQQIQQWALTHEDIRAVLVVGSRARSHHIADDFSDLDLILLTTNASRYRTDGTWLSTFGTVLLSAVDVLQSGDPEWIVVYEGVLKGDFSFFQVSQNDSLADQLAHFPFQNVLARGIRILVDKFPQSKPLLTPSRPFQMPTSDRFQHVVANFWIVVTRVAKFIQRGDLWRAVTMLYCKLRADLLTMMEWYAHAVHGLDYDTWYDGRYLEEWLDADTIAALPDLLARYNPAELQAALLNMVNLFRCLAQVVATHLGFEYPEVADIQLTAWLETF